MNQENLGNVNDWEMWVTSQEYDDYMMVYKYRDGWCLGGGKKD